MSRPGLSELVWSDLSELIDNVVIMFLFFFHELVSTSQCLQLATVFSDFSFSPSEKPEKESTQIPLPPKKTTTTKREKKDISLSQTVLEVKPSLVPGLHEFQSSSPFYLGVICLYHIFIKSKIGLKSPIYSRSTFIEHQKMTSFSTPECALLICQRKL